MAEKWVSVKDKLPEEEGYYWVKGIHAEGVIERGQDIIRVVERNVVGWRCMSFSVYGHYDNYPISQLLIDNTTKIDPEYQWLKIEEPI